LMQVDSFIVATESSDVGAITADTGGTQASIVVTETEDTAWILATTALGTLPAFRRGGKQVRPHDENMRRPANKGR
jgi:hypothetical protein